MDRDRTAQTDPAPGGAGVAAPAASAAGADAGGRPGAVRLRGAILLALATLAATGFWARPLGTQGVSRYAFTAAMADHGTVVIDRYEFMLGVDRVVKDGTVYSDKAPGQPILAIPAYVVFRALGGAPAEEQGWGAVTGPWAVTFSTAAVPLALLAALVYLTAARLGRRPGAVTLMVVFGTILLPFGSMLFGHVLAAVSLFAGYRLLRAPRASRAALIGGGALLGLSVLTEYTAAVGVVIVLAFGLRTHRSRVGWVVLGGVPFAVALGVYNLLLWGGPLTFSYQFSAFGGVAEGARGVLGPFSNFSLEHLWAVFLDDRGLLVATPIVVVGIVESAWLAFRKRSPEGAVALAMLVAYLALVVSWSSPWAGLSPGPRYMTVALPFLVVPLASAMGRYPRLVVGAGALSAFTMVMATLTEPRLSRYRGYGLRDWLSLAGEGRFGQTIFAAAPVAGWVLAVAIVVTAVVVWRRGRAPRSPAITDAGEGGL